MNRIQGAGSLEKRGKNVWRVRFNLGQDPITGRYRYAPWRTVHGTKAQAQAALAEYRKELESGIRLDADTVTFREYSMQYLAERGRTKGLAPSTCRYYEYTAGLITNLIGDMPLRDIDSTVVKAVLSSLSENGRKRSCVKRVWVMLNQILKGAVRDDLIMRNPCDKVDAPKASPRPEPKYLEAEDVARLVTALDKALLEAERLENTHRTTTPRTKEPEHRYERGKSLGTLQRSHVMGVFLGLATGCRMGEVLGFTWGSVDFEQVSIKVKQQNTIDGVRDTKTPQSKRTIALDGDTLERLKTWKVKQAEFLLSLGIAQDKDTPIVTNEYGECHDPRGFSKWWRKFRKANGFEDLNYHQLRHTQATLLIAQGMDFKTVQGRMGHTLASTTLDFYAHAMPAKDKEAAEIVGTILTTPAPLRGEVVNL